MVLTLYFLHSFQTEYASSNIIISFCRFDRYGNGVNHTVLIPLASLLLLPFSGHLEPRCTGLLLALVLVLVVLLPYLAWSSLLLRWTVLVFSRKKLRTVLYFPLSEEFHLLTSHV